MKLLLAFLLFTVSLYAPAQAAPAMVYTTQQQTILSPANDSDAEGTDGFSTGMAAMTVLGIIVTAICIGIGIVLAIVALLIFFIFMSVGIISTSVIVGLDKQSFAKGFKTFLVLSSAAAGLFITATLLFIVNGLFGLNLSGATAVIMGGICGILAGSAVGLVAYYIFKLMALRFKQKLGFF